MILSIMFKKGSFAVEDCLNWLKKYKFGSHNMIDKKKYYVFFQAKPEEYEVSKSFSKEEKQQEKELNSHVRRIIDVYKGAEDDEDNEETNYSEGDVLIVTELNELEREREERRRLEREEARKLGKTEKSRQPTHGSENDKLDRELRRAQKYEIKKSDDAKERNEL
jgi:hypothetical protein